MGQCCQRRRAANEDCAEDLAPHDDVSLSAASESVWTPPMTAHQRRTTVSTRSLTEEALIEVVNDESRTAEVRAYAQAELDRR